MAMSLQQVSDRLEINDLLIDYATAVDSKDLDAWDDIFTPDAYIDYSAMGGAKGPMPEVRTWLKKAFERFPMSQHMIGNSRVHLDGDSARARTICYNPMQMPDGKGGFQLAMFGLWYVDQLVRTRQGWRIAERVEEYGYVFNLPEGFKPEPSI